MGVSTRICSDHSPNHGTRYVSLYITSQLARYADELEREAVAWLWYPKIPRRMGQGIITTHFRDAVVHEE